MIQPVPIAVFTYNRPQHARQMLDSLANCSRLNECRVVIFSDAPRIAEHIAGVEENRRLIHAWAKQNQAQVIERSENFGLARSIVGGVTEQCEQHGRVIVLEDDFILHPFFLDFMLQSLDRYEDDEQVTQVAGFTFPIDALEEVDAFFLPLTTSWGWATWQRAWKLFSWETRAALETLDANPGLRGRFDLDGAYPYTEMLRRTAAGELNSWAIRWYWHAFSTNKLTLYPRRSLVWQNGFDKTATHTTVAKHNMQMPIHEFLQEKKWRAPILFPEAVQTDEITFQQFKNFLQRESSRSFQVRVRGMLKRMFARLVE